MYHGYIYLILDQKTKKVYVGQKKGKIEDSKNYYGSGITIQQIINKHGTYFLKKIILGICYSKEELNEAEKECIYFFKSYGKDGSHHDNIYGYNLTKGGDGGDINSNHPNKENIYEKQKQKWNNKSENEKQIIIEKRSTGQKNNYKEHPEKCIKLSNTLLAFNKNNPELGKSKSNKMKQFYIDFPEEKIKRSEESKKRWQDPIYRDLQSKRQKERWDNDPNSRINHGKTIKDAYINNPEKRQEQGAKSRQRYIDCPEERKSKAKDFLGKTAQLTKKLIL